MASPAEMMAKFGGVPADDTKPTPDTSTTPAPTTDQGSGGVSAADLAAKYGGEVVDQTDVPTTVTPSSDDKTATSSDEQTDWLGSAGRGLKQTLAPFLLSKEDMDGKRTKGDVATEVGTTLASDVAVGAGVGLIIGPEGAALGAGAAAMVHVAMAAYRGFGYEYAKSKAEGQAFDPIRGTVNSLTQLNPLVGKGGRILKAGTQALLEYTGAKMNGADDDQAMVQGAIGGAVGGILHHNTGEWIGIIGVTAARPNSSTTTPGNTTGTMQGFLQLFGDRSRAQLGKKLEENEARVGTEYFKLGDKLDRAKALLEDDTASMMNRMMDEGGPDHYSIKSEPGAPQFNRDVQNALNFEKSSKNILDAGDKDLIAHMDSFKAWVFDQPGMRIMDKDVDASFEHYATTKGDKWLNDSYAMFQRKNLADATIDQYVNEVATDQLYRNKKTGEVVNRNKVDIGKGEGYERVKLEDPLQNGWIDKLTDLQFVARKVDRTLGTNLSGAVNNVSEAKNQVSNIISGYLERANALTTMARKADLDQDTIGRYLAQDDINLGRAAMRKSLHEAENARTGGTAGAVIPDHLKDQDIQFNPAQQKVVQGWRKMFEDMRTELNNRGLKVDFLDGEAFDKGGNYLPMKSMTGADAASSIRQESARLQGLYGPDYLEHPESFNLKRTVGQVLGKDPSEVKFGNDIDNAQREALKPSNKTLQGYEGGASFQRTAGLPAPEFIRDFDVGRLFTNYANNNLKSVVYADAFSQMSLNIEMLRRVGFSDAADYWTKYINTMSGQQSNFLAGVTAQTNKLKDVFNRVLETDVKGTGVVPTIQRGAIQVARGLPDFAAFCVSSIYPNYLGWNVHAAMRDLAKPFLTLAPELGWDYGLKVVSRSIAHAAWEKVTGSVESMEHELQSRGLAPGHFFGESGNLADNALRNKRTLGAVVEKVDKFQQWSMAMYSQSDKANRYITLKTAQNIVEDLKNGNQRAADFVMRSMSEGDKAAFRSLGVRTLDDLRKADSNKVADVLASQLIAKTQFNYGKEGMNEYGRDMGRIFSMFTKWPATILSDGADLVHGHGWQVGGFKAVQRYLAPIVALGVTSHFLLDTEHNPMQKFLLGDNLADWAPGMAIKVGTPPILMSAMDFSKTFLDMLNAKDDGETRLSKAGSFLGKQAGSYLPGMSILNERARWLKANGENN